MAEKASDLISAPPLITALATAVGAWKLFEPKFERIRVIRETTGRLEPGFRVLYVMPQWLLAFVSTFIVAMLVLAFWDSLSPITLARFLPVDWVRKIVQPTNVIWVIFLMGALGGIIYVNLITKILLGFASLLALLPLPSLENRFGRRGHSIGWLQTAAVCEGPDKGAPLLVDHRALDSLAWEVLARLSQKPDQPLNYAAEPSGFPNFVKANILLFGCIIEAIAHSKRWPSPDWSKFYEALSDIQKSAAIFSPHRLRSFSSGDAFFGELRVALEDALKAKEQPVPPNLGLAAAADVINAWSLLQSKYSGNTLKLIPFYAPILGGKLFWLDRRLRSFPRLDDDGMRPQLVKLLIRWNTVPNVDGGIFVQPFARSQAWLLMQNGVLRTLPETKLITFHGTGQASIARIVARRVVERVGAYISSQSTSEAKSVAAKLGHSNWRIEETTDFVLWSWAYEERKTAQNERWDKSKWRWKLEGDTIVRQD